MRIILHVSTGPSAHERLAFTEDDLPIVIGRSSEQCKAVLPYRGVSRSHCRLARLPGSRGASSLKVRDLQSTAGTFVNGHPVDRLEGASVRSGDILRVGPAVVRIELVGECRRTRRLRCDGTESTSAVAAVQVKARCEMCAGSITEQDVIDGARMLADQRAICAACVGQLGGLPTHGPLIFLQTLGTGSCATVYKALHWGQQRIVAVKRVGLSNRAASAEIVTRVMREISVGRDLRHPAIPAVQDASTDGTSFFVVMDYVEGETLEDYVGRKGPLPFAHAARIARRLGGALDHAHGKGIVHRDVKPRNVIIDRRGEAHLADFGLAKGGAEAIQLADTKHGHGLGTPHYMAPEQFVNARDCTAAADVYGLAATLFFMLTGRAPYGEEREIARIYRRVTTEVAPRASALRPSLPPAAVDALALGLGREGALRPATAAELAEAVARALDAEALRKQREPTVEMSDEDSALMVDTQQLVRTEG